MNIFNKFKKLKLLLFINAKISINYHKIFND